MLLRANGYAVLNEDKLRRQPQPSPVGEGRSTHQQHAQPAAAGQQQQAAEQQSQQQQQPARRQVRIVEPAQQQRQARRLAEKRKHVSEPSSSEGEEERGAARSQAGPRGQQLAQQPAPSQQQQQQQPGISGGMKRVRSAWKMRPLLIGGEGVGGFACRQNAWTFGMPPQVECRQCVLLLWRSGLWASTEWAWQSGLPCLYGVLMHLACVACLPARSRARSLVIYRSTLGRLCR